jgi:hypothetical protein
LRNQLKGFLPQLLYKIYKEKKREIESNGTLMDSLNKRINDDTIKWITFFFISLYFCGSGWLG